jgi:hypothetical protein
MVELQATWDINERSHQSHIQILTKLYAEHDMLLKLKMYYQNEFNYCLVATSFFGMIINQSIYKNETVQYGAAVICLTCIHSKLSFFGMTF